jgi:uncharacterized membrane protein YeaQ/YmgE (transglycosylase-associated protein family)
MNQITWMLFGILIGFVIHISEDNKRGSLSIALLFGGVGGILGGLTAATIFGIAFSRVTISAFIIAVVASVGLLYFLKYIQSPTQKNIRKEGYV